MKNNVFIVIIALALMLGAVTAMAGSGEKNFSPSTNDAEDLGKTDRQWKDGYIAGDVYFEGATHDAYEGKLTVTDPTADRTWTMPDATGTVALTNSSMTGTFTGTVNGTITQGATNAQVLVSNGTSYQNKTISGLATMANTGVLTGTLADGKIWVGNSGGSAVAQTMTGDATFANTGALSLVSNSVTAQEAFIETHTIDLWAGQASNTATITSGSVILGAYPFANVNDGREFINSVSASGATLTLAINGVVDGDTTLYKVVTMRP